MGNWELLAMSVAQLGFPSNPYTRKINNEYIDELLNDMRRKSGLKPINRDGIQAVKAGLTALKKNEILGILIDQDTTRVEGVFVDFFGKPAYTPSGAAALAITAKCPVLFGFITRQENNNHLVKFSKVFHPVMTGDKKKDILENTQLFTKEIEKAVRENPSQWVFMHRRWRHTPENLFD
jgi:Kdo2-lipid IVA lauroyltransferase/acyltransferase